MKSRVSLLFSFIIAFLLTAPLLWAADPQMVYVIQKGDTLWGISAKFLNDPNYWPNLWSKNPQVTNPHFIYPGQTVRFVDGKLEIINSTPEAGTQKAAAAQPATAEVVEEKLFSVRGNEGWLLEKELEPTGRVIAGQHSNIILGADDTLFTDIGKVHGGEDGKKYTVLRKSKMVKHPNSGDDLGYKVFPLGTIQLTHVTELNSRAIVVSSFKEIEPGDLLMPYQDLKRKEISLKMASRPVKGCIADSATGHETFAAGDTVYLDLGLSDGVEPGNLLYIVRKVNVEKMLVERYVGELPNEVVGAIVVVEASSKTSTAIIIKSIDAIFKGNEVVSTPR
jgi:hypothetical protein